MLTRLHVWLAHSLTFSRIPLAMVFWVVAPHVTAALVVLALAAATDLADGTVARRALEAGARGSSTRIGAWLDPLCDKTFAVVVFAALVVRLDASVVLVALIATRELILVPLVVIYRVSPLWRRFDYDFHALAAGKHATIAQFLAVGAILVGSPLAPILAGGAAVLGARAAIRYLRRGKRRDRPAARPPLDARPAGA